MTKEGIRGLTPLAMVFVVVLMAKAANAESVVTVAKSATGTSGQIRLDSRMPRQALSPCYIAYSPSWAAMTNLPGAYVVLCKTEMTGRSGESKTTLLTGSYGVEGVYTLSVEDCGERCVRLTHEVKTSGGAVVSALTNDIAFAYQSEGAPTFIANSRTNSLQEVVDAGAPVNLTYSTAWATNAAAVSIKAVQLSGSGGVPVATNEMFSAVADAEGATSMRGPGRGWWQLLCQITDGSGDTLLEYLTDEFWMKGGFTLTVR